VRLVGKSLVGKERDAYPTKCPPTSSEGSSTWAHMAVRTGFGGNVSRTSQVVWDHHLEPGKEVRVTVGREGFEYAYKCKHCGHQWVEKRSDEAQTLVEKR
jgi:hypothetical protein